MKTGNHGNSIICIGDIHGCYNTLLLLIDKCPADREICFVGDLIDRGPRSRQIIDYVMNNDHYCVRGNHEELALNHFDNPNDESYKNAWLWNGGTETLASYPEGKMSDMHISFLRSLPLYLEFPHLTTEDGRELLVSHTTVARLWDLLKGGESPDSDLLKEICWTRDPYPPSIPGKFNIYGHTPVGKPVVKDHFANIDTGCVYTWGDKMTALLFPEMKIIQQECADNTRTRLF